METKDCLNIIQSFVNTTPDKVMFVDENGTRQTSYAEFWALTQKIAALVSQRLGRRERLFVPIYLKDSMEYFAAEMAVWMTGNATVHMGVSFPPERVAYIMQHCEAELMIDGLFIAEARQQQERFTDIRRRTADQPCAMFYTSGSTGNPKGVLHSDAGFMHAITRFDKGFSLKGYKTFASTAACYFVVLVTTYSLMLQGSELHILAPEVRRDVHLLEDYIAAHEIEFANISPSLLRVYRNKAKSLKVIKGGGERLVGCYSKDYTVLNTFGQTETAGPVFIKPLDRNYDNAPIGRPTPGVEIVLLDDEGREVADGETGELCFKSGMHSPIYYKEPERTATLTAGGVQHTGDLVRRLPNGDVLYVQRKDWMVKINGLRVEPGEVETVMRHIAGVKDAIVKGFTTDDLTRQYLVGYYIVEEGATLGEESIKAEMGKKVPQYMVPQYMVRMDAFPLNANNKVDRKSLLPPDLSAMQSPYAAPTNEVERKLCDAFAKVLHLERVGIDDDFTHLGGDSIRLMQMQQSLPYSIPANIVLTMGTPRKIAAYHTDHTNSVANTESMTDYPLNSGQLFFLKQGLSAPESSASYFPWLHRLSLCIDVERLKSAVEQTVNAHPGMMMRVVADGNGGYRLRSTTEPWQLPIEKMTDGEFESLRPHLFRCFRYLEEMLFEVRLIRTESAVYLYHNMHHVITDGLSNTLFIQEISQAYGGTPIPREQQTIFEFNAEMEQARHTAVYEECKEWFAREFKDSPAGQDLKAEAEMKTYKRLLNIPSQQQMEECCKKYGATLNVLFMSAAAKAIGQLEGKQDVRLTTSFHGRLSQQCQRTFGFLATPRLYRFRWEQQEPMSAYLTRSKEHVMGNMARAVMPMREMMQMMGLPWDATMFIYQGRIGTNALVLDGIVAESRKLPTQTPDTRPMCIFIYDADESAYSIDVWYDTSKYTDDYVASLVSQFETIINTL